MAASISISTSVSTATSSSISPLSLLRPSSLRHHHLPVSSHRHRCRLVLVAPAAARVSSVVGEAAAIGEGNDGDEEEEVEEEEAEVEEAEEEGFVTVGCVSKAHGVKGEVRVVPNTGFPELRFGEPGKRWLRTRVAGKERIKEVELTGGRGRPGQKTWIVAFDGINTVEEARQIVGSTILIREGDRPELDEGEFYTRDLVGMRVFLKDTGRLVGTVANVFDFGAGDLLQVMFDSTDGPMHRSNSVNQDANSSGAHVWIPFVEAIVPDVDMEKREIWITPPKGLLELNRRSDTRSKKERRLMVRNGKRGESYSNI